jgi:hypothetical protein
MIRGGYSVGLGDVRLNRKRTFLEWSSGLLRNFYSAAVGFENKKWGHCCPHLINGMSVRFGGA